MFQKCQIRTKPFHLIISCQESRPLPVLITLLLLHLNHLRRKWNSTQVQLNVHPGLRWCYADSWLKNVMGMNIKCKNMCKHVALYCCTPDTALWWSSFSGNITGALTGIKVKAKLALCHRMNTQLPEQRCHKRDTRPLSHFLYQPCKSSAVACARRQANAIWREPVY